MSATSHWRGIGQNPIAPSVCAHVKAQLEECYRGPILELGPFWEAIMKNKSVLDIGVVEHSREFTERAGWRHEIFKELASSIMGVDILEDEVEYLRQRGYDVQTCDATSENDLGKCFETVYAGDVIEHVDNPIGLISFAQRHLADGGSAYISTPCPFWWSNIWLAIRDGTYVGNVDHIRWVTPVNALEMAHRAGCVLSGYYTVETHGHTLLRKFGKSLITKTFGRNELFTWAYIYEFKQKV
ncbi:MAG: class I SAM-dependent methyltransferase [Erythrobacter sp.]|nr:class I SAM-dependent methyltransferase [Erythrobacter sp.]NCQ22401.1 class I SAM-dependent methyltransferase [Sphingomonadales bacterium]